MIAKANPGICYAREATLDVDEFIDVLRRSGLAERRPVDDRERMTSMARHANLIVSARDGATLIGIARSLCDFAYCCYCSDLAVDRAYQRVGVGRALLDHTRVEAGPGAVVLLLSAPAAMDYYPHIGMAKAENAFIYPRRS
jgi:ribosomal protein S18 acetylase RimI-like enzyme